MFRSEVNLFKHTNNLPKTDKKNCNTWRSWLTEIGSGRETIFNKVFKTLNIFVTIPVTSYSYERTFSKLSLVKTKAT